MLGIAWGITTEIQNNSAIVLFYHWINFRILLHTVLYAHFLAFFLYLYSSFSLKAHQSEQTQEAVIFSRKLIYHGDLIW